MENLFYGKQSFNDDLGAWDVARVTNMRRMFSNARAFNSDLSSWDVSSVTTMQVRAARLTLTLTGLHVPVLLLIQRRRQYVEYCNMSLAME